MKFIKIIKKKLKKWKIDLFFYFFEESLFNHSITQKILIGLLYEFFISVQHTRFIDILSLSHTQVFKLTNNLMYILIKCFIP